MTARQGQAEKMSQQLKPGDRIRISKLNRVTRYWSGQTGIVQKGPRTSPISGVIFYVVSMDKDSHAWTVVFKADEIEADK
jgi:hypothetical protein